MARCELWKGETMIACVECEDEKVAIREIAHYAMVYGQDGPCVIKGPLPEEVLMPRTPTLDKILLADATDRGMRQLQDRIERLEKAIDLHQQEITFSGHSEGRGADKKLWAAKGENWSDDYE